MMGGTRQATAYEEAVDFVVGRLRSLASDVERRGVALNTATGQPDHLAAAVKLVSLVHRSLASLGLGNLVKAAVETEWPGAVLSPASRLDRATTALAEEWNAQVVEGGQLDDDQALRLTEAALRGAGVLP